ncbi:MAG: hypothetical protein ACK4GE_04180 [Caldimicrobium sp.]
MSEIKKIKPEIVTKQEIEYYKFNQKGIFSMFAKEKHKIYTKLIQNSRARLFLDWSCNVCIRTKDYGVIRFNPNIWTYAQWKTVEALFDEDVDTVVILKGRQLGITTVVLMFDLFYAFTIDELQGIIVGCDYEQVRRPIFLIREMYKTLPKKFKRKVLENSLVRIRFDNGSYFDFFYPSRRIGKMGTMGRGSAVNFAHFTEFAFMANEEDIHAIEASFSTHFPYRKYIYETTANGYNFFYDRYLANKEIPTSRTFFLGWWMREDYILRDRKEIEYYMEKPVFSWEDDKIKEVKELYGVELAPEQIAWWRKVAIKNYARNEAAVLKEFPFTEEEAFSASGKEFFYVKNLKDQKSVELPKEVYLVNLTGTWYETRLIKSNFGQLRLWRPFSDVNKYATYIVGVDPAFSTSPSSCNSAFVVLECYADKVIQVAEFEFNQIDVLSFAFLVLYIAAKYNDAIINYEVAAGGAAFIQFLQNIWSHITTNSVPSNEYIEELKKARFREYIYKRRDSIGIGQAKGIIMSQDMKMRGILTLDSMIRNRQLEIKSYKLMNEIENILVHEDEIVMRRTGKTPMDLFMALIIGLIAYQDLPRGGLYLYKDAIEKFEKEKKMNEEEKKRYELEEITKSFNNHLREFWFKDLMKTFPKNLM